MLYYSTRNPELRHTLDQVILNGLAPDGGLYLPQKFNQLPPEFWDRATSLTYQQILYEVLITLTAGDEYNRQELKEEIEAIFDFQPELIALETDLTMMDLNTGPTSAFKDYGANTLGIFLRAIIGQSANVSSRRVNTTQLKKTILVATSGDTGAAVANSLKDYGLSPAIQVVILYPKGRVSEDQRLLMTTIGGNITCLEVDGTFDDCQAMVKQAMSDPAIKERLTSANSINLIRLYGQVAHFIYAGSRGIDPKTPNLYCVPSGNLGNVTAGYIAMLMGNPTKQFLVGHNTNDMFNQFVLEGILNNQNTAKATISSAMDISRPSNLERLVVLFGGSYNLDGTIYTMPDIAAMQKVFYVQGFGDEETQIKIKQVQDNYNQAIDPHTAIGFLVLEQCIATQHPEYKQVPAVILSTAHCSKFGQIYFDSVGAQAPVSGPILEARGKSEHIVSIGASYEELAKWL
ncbi:MAG: threonine synthase [Candidatus Parcubacteria bacterium]|nr:threonine synthase [Candidatus Paceibacterota bacterium]